MSPTQTEKASSTARSGEHLLFLDYIRGIAIFLVLGYHVVIASHGMKRVISWDGWLRDFTCMPYFLQPFSAGMLGVAIFFVVSGFCIHLSHEKSKQKAFEVFFVRRFFRIYPPYLLALCFFAIVFAPTRLHFDSWDDLAQLGTHLLLINNVDKDFFYGINGSFWSIVVEAQLYLIYPLLLLIVRRFGWTRALWFTGLLEVFVRAGCAIPLPEWLSCSPLSYWFSWSIGAKLADDYLKGRPLFMTHCPLWVWPAVICVAFAFKPIWLFSFIFTALATTKWISHLLSHRAAPSARPPLVLRFFQWLGVISYSLYLVHEPILTELIKSLTPAPGHFLVPPLHFFLYVLAFGGVTFFIAWLFHLLVELPSINAGKWFLKRRLPTQGLPAPGKHF